MILFPEASNYCLKSLKQISGSCIITQTYNLYFYKNSVIQ